MKIELKCIQDINGKVHTPIGPAIRKWNNAGQLIMEDYWIDGNKLSKEQFNARKNACNGKIVVIDGVQYKLTPV